MRRRLFAAATMVAVLGAAGVVVTAAWPAAAEEDASIGTPGYFLKSGREYAQAGDWAMAETYAKLALNLDPSHAGARELLARAQQARVGAAPRPSTAPARATAGDPEQIGSAAYFLKHARRQLRAGQMSGAASYAREALSVDPGNAEAKAILARADAARAPASRPNAAASSGAAKSCDEIYGACYASARRYTPGGGYSADFAAQQQCMVQRNICYGRSR